LSSATSSLFFDQERDIRVEYKSGHEQEKEITTKTETKCVHERDVKENKEKKEKRELKYKERTKKKELEKRTEEKVELIME